MNEPIRPAHTEQQHDQRSASLPSPSPIVRILLLALTVIGGALSGICPDLISASFFAVVTAGLFSYCFLLTFSPLVLAAPVISAIAAFAATANFYHGLQALLYLPLGVSVCLSMLRVKKKTSAVLRGAVSVGISILVLFLIGFMMTHLTISPDALKQSYNNFFETMQAQMTDSMLTAYDAMEQAAHSSTAEGGFSHPVIDAPITDGTADIPPQSVPDPNIEKQRAAAQAYIRAMVDVSVNSVKLAAPALFAVFAQTLSYLALGIYQLTIRLCRTPYMLPRSYRITVSRTAAVIFVVAYLINLFPGDTHISVLQIATANLSTILMPGIFVMGLNSLVRRAKDPIRRRSFIITAVVLGFLVFIFPSYAIFFVLVDGIGEIFFGGRSIF